MIENLNKRFEEGGALARAELHCLEQITWTEKEIVPAFNTVWGMRRIEGGGFDGGMDNYKSRSKNSADAVFYISTYLDDRAVGRADMGSGLSKSLESFRDRFYSWIHLGWVTSHGVHHHELGHNLGNSHSENFDMWTNFLMKRFRFALAAIGDEEEPCPKQEADWEFRSRCFKSFGQYTGGELEEAGSTTAEKSAKECQARCAATEGCSFFSFKEAGAGCHMSSAAAELTYAEGVVGGPVYCNTGACLKNVKYSPIDDFPGAQRSMETSSEACRARCASDSQCAYFSFWEKELPDDNGCTLFGSSATFGRENETVLYITGPATCPGKLSLR